MFAIQPINKFYSTKRYVAINSETNIPYLVYECNADYPQAIHDFGTLEAATDYLTKFITRENIDINKLTTAQVIDVVLVNNCNQFDIIEYEIEEGQVKVKNTYTQPQFNRSAWFKG